MKSKDHDLDKVARERVEGVDDSSMLMVYLGLIWNGSRWVPRRL